MPTPAPDIQPRLRRRPPLLLPGALCVTFAGLFAAAVLSAGHLLAIPVPCGGSRGCGAVAAHPSSRLLGVPIAYLGVAAYLLFAWLLTRAPASRAARLLLLTLAAPGALASAALLVYSKSVIGAACAWCLASGAAMAALLVLAILIVRAGPALRPAPGRLVFALAALASAAIGVQAGLMLRDANRAPVPAARLAGLTTVTLVDPAKAIGPEDAPITILVFADLYCPACRRVQSPLIDYQKSHPRAVRLAYRHLPLWDHSAAAAALSEVAAEHDRFWAFADALHALPGRPSRDSFLSIITSLGLDDAAAEARIADPADPALVRLQRDIDLAAELGVTATPTFIIIVKGEQPVSASQRTLPRLLNSPVVLSHLARAMLEQRDLVPPE